jgi:predicted CDP-diglyceride synthetase/phosphatidate cytidylyltransferase
MNNCLVLYYEDALDADSLLMSLTIIKLYLYIISQKCFDIFCTLNLALMIFLYVNTIQCFKCYRKGNFAQTRNIRCRQNSLDNDSD